MSCDSGLTWIVKSCLESFLGPELMDSIHAIIANEARVDAEDRWHITWVDDTPFGHDKARTITSYLQKLAHGETSPKTYYLGDGISDISAGKTCDVLFAKADKDLATWCVREKQPCHLWSTFADIHDVMRPVLSRDDA